MPIVIDPTSVVKLKNRKQIAEDGRWIDTTHTADLDDGRTITLDSATMRWLFDTILELGRNLVIVDIPAGGTTWQVCDG